MGYKYKCNLIEKYECQKFLPSISIELLHYINTYLFQEVQYNKCSYEEFTAKAEEAFNISEVRDAREYLKIYDKYHTDIIDAILAKNTEKIYKIELEKCRKEKYKFLVKRLLLH